MDSCDSEGYDEMEEEINGKLEDISDIIYNNAQEKTLPDDDLIERLIEIIKELESIILSSRN